MTYGEKDVDCLFDCRILHDVAAAAGIGGAPGADADGTDRGR